MRPTVSDTDAYASITRWLTKHPIRSRHRKIVLLAVFICIPLLSLWYLLLGVTRWSGIEKTTHQDVDISILWSTECYNSFRWLCKAWCVARVVTAGQRECAQSLKTLWLVFTVGPLFFGVSTSNSPQMQGVVLRVFKSAPCNSNYVANQP